MTALLRQMGAPKIISRATDDLHERVLRLVGAHEVVNPERAYGERLATRLAHQGVADIIPLGDGLALTELIVPASFVGRSLIELPAEAMAPPSAMVRKIAKMIPIMTEPMMKPIIEANMNLKNWRMGRSVLG